MSGVQIYIKGLDELIAEFERIERIARIHWPNDVMDKGADVIKRHIEQRAPGTIGQTVKIKKLPDRRTVTVEHPAAIFVNDGTAPSPGRFVPALGRRLVSTERMSEKGMRPYNIGMHPGTPATHFFDKAIEDADREIGANYDKWMEERL